MRPPYLRKYLSGVLRPFKGNNETSSPNLKCAFLDDDKKYPIVVDASLDGPSLEKLFHVLRKCKRNLRYCIDDIKASIFH